MPDTGTVNTPHLEFVLGWRFIGNEVGLIYKRHISLYIVYIEVTNTLMFGSYST